MKISPFLVACLTLCSGIVTPGFSQETAFTYQGVLQEGGSALNGTVDLTFTLFDALNDGHQVGATFVVNDLAVTNGLVNVSLDFGLIAFDGQPRWLGIAVRPGTATGQFTSLQPRTPVTATPYALYASSASASGLVGLLPDSSLPSSLARRDGGNTFTGNQFLSGGRVGIGTVTPDTKLTVVESTYGIEHTDGTRRLATYIDASGCYFGTVSVDPLFFYVNNGGSPLMINTNGNVGIGTADPATALEVNGTIKATQFSGDGSGLTGIPASGLTGLVPEAQIPSTLARLDGGNTFSGDQRINGGGVNVPNGQISVGGDFIANANQFIAGTANINNLHVTNGVVASSFTGDGNGLSGIAKIDGGNTFSGDQRVNSGSVSVPNGQIAVGGDLIANANQFIAGTANVNNLHVTNGVVAGSFTGDGNGLSGIAKINGGNTFNGNQRVVGGSLSIGSLNPVSTVDVRSTTPVITVGTTANEGGAVHFGNAAHGVKRAYIGQNDVGLYTTSADVYLSANGIANNQFVLKNDGKVGIGTSDPTEKLHVSGNVRVSGDVNVQNSAGVAKVSMAIDPNGKGKLTCDYIQINGGADIAEPFEIQSNHSIEPGMIVAIDPSRPGELRLSSRAYDPTVAGIISGANGIQPGLMLQQKGTLATGHHPVALSGRVWCYSDADAGGEIVPGDMLTSANEPGHAMKAADRDRAFGTIIGKAMTPLAKGKGLVLVLVSLQ